MSLTRTNLSTVIALAAGLVGVVAYSPVRLDAATIPSVSWEGQPPDAATADAASLGRLLSDATAPVDARRTAAILLAGMAEKNDAAAIIRSALAGPVTTGSAADFMLIAFSKVPLLPAGLFEAAADAVARAPSERLPEVLPGLASFRTRRAAALLLTFAAPDKPAAQSAAVFAALARLTGRTDIAPDRATWGSFIAAHEPLTEQEWRDRLLTWSLRYADLLTEQRRQASTRVADAFRKLHLATRPEDRSALLAAMLLDDDGVVRDLGIELTGRELSAARRLDPAVGEAALKLLASPNAQVRESAALLVVQLNPSGASEAILAALERETDPRVAAAILPAATRTGGNRITASVLRWLESRSPAAVGAAADSAYVLLRNGVLSNSDRERVLGALQHTPIRQLNASGCRLVAALGSASDLEALSTLLESSSAALKIATAEALATDREYLDKILRAAAEEPQLFEFAVTAVTFFRTTEEGYRAIEMLPAPTPEVKRRALVTLAARLPAPDVVRVARTVKSDVAFRESVLATLASQDRILSERVDPVKLAELCNGLLMLAQDRIELDRPDSAIVALDAIPDHSACAHEQALTHARVLCLLCLGRIEDAQMLEAPPEVWFEAIERCATRPFARSIADALVARFGETLPDIDRQRLARLTAALPETQPQPGDREFVGPLQPG